MESMDFKLRWTDLSGKKCVDTLHVEAGDVTLPNTHATALQAALNACSDAEIYHAELIGADVSVTGTATTNAYGSPNDKLEMIYKGATSGLLTRFAFPCPKPAIFLTDNETPNEADTDYSTLRDWITTNAKGTSGEALIYVRGRRIKTFAEK